MQAGYPEPVAPTMFDPQDVHAVQVSRAQLVEEDAAHKANHVGNKGRRLGVTPSSMLTASNSNGFQSSRKLNQESQP